MRARLRRRRLLIGLLARGVLAREISTGAALKFYLRGDFREAP